MKKKKSTDLLDKDLTSLFDRKDWKKINFELLQKNKIITLRINDELLKAIKAKAQEEGIDYQKWIRESLMAKLNRSE